MTLQELDDIFQSLVRNDRQLSAIRKKIKDGKATFKDTAAYNERISTLFGETLSRHITDIPEDQRKDVCEKLLRGRYIDMNSKLAQVQTALDEAEGIRIAPQRPAFPTERVRKVAGALEDKTASEEVIRRRANGPVANVSKSFHDDYMKTNAAFRSRFGLKCYIDRDAASGCCDWCSEIEGHYRYGEEPKDVYRRHDNCSCTTTYKNGRERQDVWSKKTWNTPEPGAGAAPPTILTSEQAAELSIRLQPRVLTGNAKSGTIKSEGIVEDRKVTDFFLKKDAKHSEEFFAVGYSPAEPERLKEDLLAALSTGERIDQKQTEHGERFSILCYLGVTQKKQFRLVWQIDTPEGLPRIITAHREDDE